MSSDIARGVIAKLKEEIKQLNSLNKQLLKDKERVDAIEKYRITINHDANWFDNWKSQWNAHRWFHARNHMNSLKVRRATAREAMDACIRKCKSEEKRYG